MSPSEKRPRLGSLAQAARGKHLKQIRGILVAIGILTIIANIAIIFVNENQAKEAIQRGVNRAVVEQELRTIQLFNYLMVGVGVLYVMFAFIVHLYPVAVTITALVIYAGLPIVAIISMAQVNPGAVGSGLWIRILIIVALAGSIKTAVEYEKERRQEEEEDEEEDEDADEEEEDEEEDDRPRRRRR